VATPGSCAKQDGVTTRRGVQILPDCWCYSSQYGFGIKFVCRKIPSKFAVNRLFNMFEVTGTVVDNTKAVVGKKKAEHQKTLHMLNKH